MSALLILSIAIPMLAGPLQDHAAAEREAGAARISERGTGEPLCPPAGCPIPVPYPVLGVAPAQVDEPTPPEPMENKGDEPGVLKGPISQTTRPPDWQLRSAGPAAADPVEDPAPPADEEAPQASPR